MVFQKKNNWRLFFFCKSLKTEKGQKQMCRLFLIHFKLSGKQRRFIILTLLFISSLKLRDEEFFHVGLRAYFMFLNTPFSTTRTVILFLAPNIPVDEETLVFPRLHPLPELQWQTVDGFIHHCNWSLAEFKVIAVTLVVFLKKITSDAARSSCLLCHLINPKDYNFFNVFCTK